MHKKIFIASVVIFTAFAFSNAVNLLVSKDTEKLAKSENLENSITANRKGNIILTGKPGSTVKIQQLSHEFWFGCNISSAVFTEDSKMSANDKRMYKEKFLENFNAAVTENSLKWASMEPIRGEINYKTTDNILDWTEENNLPLRGHNLYWGIKKFVQEWVKKLDKNELGKALKKRGIKTAKHFKGRFYEYDLNNEMIHGNYYEEILGDAVTKDMSDWVLKGDPKAKLWLNDYDILTGNRLDEFLEHIRKLQKQQVPIAGIGVQGHLHKETFSRDKLKEALDSLAQFDLPIRITEFNIPGQRSKYHKIDKSLKLTYQEELLKAKDLVDYYRICFAHSAVEGILMWGFWEGNNWIKVSSLYKQDWSPTPALKAYQNLIFKEWWTDVSVTLDKNGKGEVPAFYGMYKIAMGTWETQAKLEKEKRQIYIEIGK